MLADTVPSYLELVLSQMICELVLSQMILSFREVRLSYGSSWYPDVPPLLQHTASPDEGNECNAQAAVA